MGWHVATESGIEITKSRTWGTKQGKINRPEFPESRDKTKVDGIEVIHYIDHAVDVSLHRRIVISHRRCGLFLLPCGT